MIADGVTGLLMHSLASPAAMLALQKAADAVVFEEGHAHHHSHAEKGKGKHLLAGGAAESSEEDEDISEVAKKLKVERSVQQQQGQQGQSAVPTKLASQTSVLRLRKIQEGLRSTGYFDAVELNVDRTQLIVRKDNADAYCRIEWGTQQKHQVRAQTM